ncbi:MAG: hypothetical protein C4521_00110, partial [Actinobacteria bacterium]
MKRQGANRFGTKARIALVAICAGALFIAMALPAMAAPSVEMAHKADLHESVIDHAAQINESAVQQVEQADQDGDDSQLGDQPGDENFPDGGGEEVVPPEDEVEPPEQLEPPTDGGDDEGCPPESDTPSVTPEPTPTPNPSNPGGNSNRTQLAYTG